MEDFLFLIGVAILLGAIILSLGYLVNGTPIIVIMERKKKNE